MSLKFDFSGSVKLHRVVVPDSLLDRPLNLKKSYLAFFSESKFYIRLALKLPGENIPGDGVSVHPGDSDMLLASEPPM